MNKILSFFLYVALAIVSGAVFIMTILASAGVQDVWLGMPIIYVLAVLAVALVISVIAFNPKKKWYSIGFYLLHIGIVLFLAGGFVYNADGVETNATPPNVGSITSSMEYQMMQYGITPSQISNLKGYYNQIGSDGEAIDLGFNFRITSFKTELYEDNKSVKHYEATLEFLNDDGTVESKSLTVNHPIYKNGWKIYLMDVSANVPYGYQEINLMFKKDPTEFLSNSGIVLTVIGTFVMCFIRPIKKGNDIKSLSKKTKTKEAKK